MGAIQSVDFKGDTHWTLLILKLSAMKIAILTICLLLVNLSHAAPQYSFSGPVGNAKSASQGGTFNDNSRYADKWYDNSGSSYATGARHYQGGTQHETGAAHHYG